MYKKKTDIIETLELEALRVDMKENKITIANISDSIGRAYSSVVQIFTRYRPVPKGFISEVRKKFNLPDSRRSLVKVMKNRLKLETVASAVLHIENARDIDSMELGAEIICYFLPQYTKPQIQQVSVVEFDALLAEAFQKLEDIKKSQGVLV